MLEGLETWPGQTANPCVLSGLGEELSKAFAKEGANIAVNYCNRIEPAQKVQKACEEYGVKAVVIQADLTLTSGAKRAVQETIKQLGGLDLIISNLVCSPCLLLP